MTRKITLTVLISFFLFAAFSQDKQLTLEDAVYMNPKVLPKRLNQLQWIGKSDRFAYQKANKLMQAGTSEGTEKVLATVDDLNAGLTDLEKDSIKRFPRVNFVDDQHFYFTHKNSLYLYNFISRNLEVKSSFPTKTANRDVDPNTFAVAYTIDNNLYLANKDKQLTVSSEENKGYILVAQWKLPRFLSQG